MLPVRLAKYKKSYAQSIWMFGWDNCGLFYISGLYNNSDFIGCVAEKRREKRQRVTLCIENAE